MDDRVLSQDDIKQVRELRGELNGVFEWVSTQQRDYRDQLERAERGRLEAFGRYMAVAAGIVGIVVPLLARAETSVFSTDARAVKHAVWLLLLSIALPAIGQAVFRRLSETLADAFIRDVAADAETRFNRIQRVAKGLIPDPDPTLEEAAKATHHAFEAARKRRNVFRTVEELLFYLLFVGGLLRLGAAIQL